MYYVHKREKNLSLTNRTEDLKYIYEKTSGPRRTMCAKNYGKILRFSCCFSIIPSCFLVYSVLKSLENPKISRVS